MWYVAERIGAVRLSPHFVIGTQYMLILALARNGFVRWRIANCNTSTQNFLDLLHFNLNPGLKGRGFLLIIDNLSVHHTTAVSDYIDKAATIFFLDLNTVRTLLQLNRHFLQI
jgi:hypothetical protein